MNYDFLNKKRKYMTKEEIEEMEASKNIDNLERSRPNPYFGRSMARKLTIKTTKKAAVPTRNAFSEAG